MLVRCSVFRSLWLTKMVFLALLRPPVSLCVISFGPDRLTYVLFEANIISIFLLLEIFAQITPLFGKPPSIRQNVAIHGNSWAGWSAYFHVWRLHRKSGGDCRWLFLPWRWRLTRWVTTEGAFWLHYFAYSLCTCTVRALYMLVHALYIPSNCMQITLLALYALCTCSVHALRMLVQCTRSAVHV